MDKNLKSDLILYAAICFPQVSFFFFFFGWSSSVLVLSICIEQSCVCIKEHPPNSDQNVSWTSGSLASTGQHFKCLMVTVGAQLHPYPVSSPTNPISPTINTELMISALPHTQTDPNTSSLPKMQFQAVASSSAKNVPANQPGHISKCKCHRQTFRAPLKSPILAWMKSPEKTCSTILQSQSPHWIPTSFGVAELSLISPVNTTEVAAHWICSLTSTAQLISEMAHLGSITHLIMKGTKFLLLLTHTDGNEMWRGGISTTTISPFRSVSILQRAEEQFQVLIKFLIYPGQSYICGSPFSCQFFYCACS